MGLASYGSPVYKKRILEILEKKGFNVCAKEIAYPPLLNQVKKYKKLFQGKGIKLSFSPFYGQYKKAKYPGAYTKQEIEGFGLDIKEIFQKGELCNAGYNVGIVSSNGDIQICTSIDKNIGNIYEKINFKNNLIKCPFYNCSCPVYICDPYLFKKAVNRIRISNQKNET